ncbi:MAG: SIR2 family protein [Proteobacteria bacterium]|nr:SIR2 family protein [Pseudomonadota bacterium]
MVIADRILLTGAGFTHNFGAPLAAELWSLVFNHPAGQGAKRVREELLQDQNFERAYNTVVTEERFCPGDRMAIHAAVTDAFESVDKTLRDWRFTASGPRPVNIYEVQRLIGRFAGPVGGAGLFFTLNQDLFLERHYYNGERPAVAGIPHHSEWFSSTFSSQKLEHEHGRTLPKNAPDVAGLLNKHRFLYVKLHGSSNWYSSDGTQRMVIGRGKIKQIASEPLLAAYWRLFEHALTSGKRRLLIIGYGFADAHVNQVLANAVDSRETELFVLSPQLAKDFKSDLSTKPSGDRIWKGLRGYLHGSLLDAFPADQSTSPLAREIESRFFSG